MIHILAGDNIKNKGTYIKELTIGYEVFYFSSDDLTKNLIMNYSSNSNLFGLKSAIVLENILNEVFENFSVKDLELLKMSDTLFILKEDKILASSHKKYTKFADIKIFEDKKNISIQKFNIFSITDAFGNRDKISTWNLYNKAISLGVEPEAISGMLFWKIKNMILNGSNFFKKEELEKQSSDIISIYHKAHKGEIDFVVSIEQFLLKSLSSK